MVSMRSKNHICPPPHLSEVSPTLPLNKGRSSSAFSFHASLLQAIDGVISLALCLQVGSQAPQHFSPRRKPLETVVVGFSSPVYLLGYFP